jgi:hypothetical protein
MDPLLPPLGCLLSDTHVKRGEPARQEVLLKLFSGAEIARGGLIQHVDVRRSRAAAFVASYRELEEELV